MKKLLIFFLLLPVLFAVEMTPLSLNTSQTVTVEVRGQLENPGLFTLNAPAFFYELLPQLQLLSSSSLDQIGYTELLKDGQIIVIAAKEETALLVSINAAPLEELMTLPGIGAAIAERIVAYRQANGGFKTLEELMEVKGIGTAKFEALRQKICL